MYCWKFHFAFYAMHLIDSIIWREKWIISCKIGSVFYSKMHSVNRCKCFEICFYFDFNCEIDEKLYNFSHGQFTNRLWHTLAYTHTHADVEKWRKKNQHCISITKHNFFKSIFQLFFLCFSNYWHAHSFDQFFSLSCKWA